MSTPWPIVFMGTPQIAAVTLEQLIQGPDPVVGVVTQPDRPTGRGQRSLPSPVRRVAESRGIPVIAPEKIRSPEFLNALREWKPEIIVVVAYGRILAKTILDLAPYGCLNVHYSLLPKYRGAAPGCLDDHQRRKDSGCHNDETRRENGCRTTLPTGSY